MLPEDRSAPNCSNQYLENLNALVKYLEAGRQDVFKATVILLEALNGKIKVGESRQVENEKLRQEIADLEKTRNKVRADLERYIEATAKQRTTNEKLTKQIEEAQTTKEDTADVETNKQLVVNESKPEERSSGLMAAATLVSSLGEGNPSLHIKSSTWSSTFGSPETVLVLPVEEPASHQFKEMSKMTFSKCSLCKASIMPLSKCFLCRNCPFQLDRACYEKLDCEFEVLQCAGKKGTVPLASLIANSAEPAVPELIRQCCQLIEQQANCGEIRYEEEDTSEVAPLFVAFICNKKLSSLDLHHRDVIWLSKLLVHTLAHLEKPLLGAKWHDFACASAFYNFSNPALPCADKENLEERTLLLESVIEQLPKPERHTLAFLMLHLKKQASESFKSNVATLYGAILLSSADTALSGTKNEQVKRANKQTAVALALLNLSVSFYETVLSDRRETTFRPMKPRTTSYSQVLAKERKQASEHLPAII